VVLAKIETTPRERTTARVMRADFALPDDLPGSDSPEVGQVGA
jgi:hypothetical protein